LAPAARARRSGVTLAVAAALGLLVAAAVVSLRAPQPSVTGARALLAEQIAERTAHADELQATHDALAAEVAQVRSDALAAADPELFAELEELELASGVTAVRGDGLVVELTDAPVADAEEADPRTRVQDIDLQIVTNGLWASGAEGIAINGQRLTALSAIRGVGPAVLVDLVPLLSPYRIEVVGDAQAVQTAFARTTAANHLASLSANLEIGVSVRAQEVELPAGAAPSLRYASPLDPDDVAGSGATEGTDDGTPGGGTS
ncbi:DUF881 domain-containing protein, partial [Actinotalea sp. JY-7885]|uniref:DUF881 domain-containing protein n=1 Tax=Actinotalea sp. JY-7885 TaxID=2758576 RepID=UPI00165D6570